MIELGPLTRGALPIAQGAHEATLHCGQIALFASTHSGKACAVPYTDPSFDWLVRRHAEHLVGVYRDDVSDEHTSDVQRRAELLREITDDLAEHLKQSRWWLLARVQKRRRAA